MKSEDTVYLAWYHNGFPSEPGELLEVCASKEMAESVLVVHRIYSERDFEYKDRADWWVEERTICAGKDDLQRLQEQYQKESDYE